MPESEELKTLKEILKWIKVSGLENIKKKISDEFSDENKILVYSLSDGKSSDEIEKILNKKITGMSIRNWWKSWAKQGLMEIHPDYKKRYKAIFNLEDFGISIPEIKLQKTEESKKIEENSEEINLDEEIKEENSEDGQELREGNTEKI